MEPWDGPASIAFTDGTVIGAVLDRNGLRPSRYYVTKDDLVIMASEVGVLDIPAEEHPDQGTPAPGPHLPRRHGAGAHRRRRGDQARAGGARSRTASGCATTWSTSTTCRRRRPAAARSTRRCCSRQQAFGYTQEDLRVLLAPMATDGEEPVGSMGTDTPLAVLSDRPRLLYDYFKQLFAQVTNPPLDAIREELVTSMESTIGPEGNLLDPSPESCRQISITYPIIDNDQLAKLRHSTTAGLPSRSTLPMLFDPAKGGAGLERAIEELQRARQRRGRGRLHDPDPVGPRRRTATRAPIPSLLATAGVHHHLVREGTRTRCGAGRRVRRRARSASLSRCSSATAPARSTRIWRSRRSTT